MHVLGPPPRHLDGRRRGAGTDGGGEEGDLRRGEKSGVCAVLSRSCLRVESAKFFGSKFDVETSLKAGQSEGGRSSTGTHQLPRPVWVSPSVEGLDKTRVNTFKAKEIEKKSRETHKGRTYDHDEAQRGPSASGGQDTSPLASTAMQPFHPNSQISGRP